MPDPVVILGLGFTTRRLARRLHDRAVPVCAAVRRPEHFRDLVPAGVQILPLTAEAVPKQSVIVHSIPPLAEPENSGIRGLISALNPRRILYISSTGVYGSQTEISDGTPVAPNDEKSRARVAEEEWIAACGVPALILRSAAIYGPGRGVHVRVREGKRPRGAGGLVSRIHADDLALILEAGIGSQIVGAWPVADDQPAMSEEVAAWCANRMGLHLPDACAPEFRVEGRRVDGKKIRELLGVELKFPSYKTGVPASLEEESKSC